MKDYYYSKFDNVNWAWWEASLISPELLVRLNQLNKQLKGLYPANILVYHYGSKDYTLISSRGQIDRDQAGRAFSFRHFVIGQQEDRAAEWLALFAHFHNPADYHFPHQTQAQTTYPISSDRKVKVIFQLLLEHCLNGKKLCIVDPDIRDRWPEKAISQLSFNNFPEAENFFGALRLLPFALTEKISFCLNYEDNFIDPKEATLPFIDVVFCGRRSVVAEGFHLEANINFELIVDNGFRVAELGSASAAMSSDTAVYDFLVDDKFANQRQQMEQCFNFLTRAQGYFSAQALAGHLLHLCLVFSRPGAFQFNMAQVKEMSEKLTADHRLASLYLAAVVRHLDNKTFLEVFMELRPVFATVGALRLLKQHAETLKASDINEVKDPVAFLNSELFDALAGKVQIAFAERFMTYPVDFSVLVDAVKFQAYGRAIGLLPQKFNGQAQWKKINEADQKTIEGFDPVAIKRLAELTNNTEEYNKYLLAIQPEPEKIALNAQLLRSPFFSLMDCFNYWPETKQHYYIGQTVYESDQLKQLIKIFLDKYESAGTLAGFLNYTAQFDKKKELALMISKRVAEILLAYIKSEQHYKKTIQSEFAEKELMKGLILAFDTAFDQFLVIDNAREFRRLLDTLRWLNVPSWKMLEWGNMLLRKESLRGHLTELSDNDSLKQELSNTISKINVWEKLELPPGFDIGKRNRFYNLLLNKRNIYIGLAGAIIIAFASAWFFSRRSGDVKPPSYPIRRYGFDSISVVKTRSPSLAPDTLALAGNFLDTSFFKNKDTLVLEQFNLKRKNHSFITFKFPNGNYRDFKIARLDSVKGNPYWNRFITLYKTGKYKITFETAHRRMDSVSRAMHLRITKITPRA